MVELIVNGNKIELPKNTAIKYTKQISDIFDLAQVACSHTTSFEFDKSPQNTQAMRQLGISGDSSNIPYIKNTAKLKADGFDLIVDGWFNVSSTDDNYKGSIIDGMIDFFKAIENKMIGTDLDLSNFNHEKTLVTVVASFTNDYYQYIVADYGGKTIFQLGINIDFLAPSFSVRKIWELIFSTFGFNCDYTNLGYLDGLYITYPKDTSEGQVDEAVATLHKKAYVNKNRINISGLTYATPNYYWDTSTIVEGNLISNWKYVIPETTSYHFDLKIAMYVLYKRTRYYSRRVDVTVLVLKNGVTIGSITSDYKEADPAGLERVTAFNRTCDAGDIIELVIFVPQYLRFRSREFYAMEWHHDHTDLVISKTDLGTTILQNEFKDFSIRDFIKETIWRTGLTPILNKLTNTVEFLTLNSRIDFANAQDLSHCFIERNGEIYQNDYAQKNAFKLKKNIDEDLTGDGYLYVPNQNLADEKVLAQSKIYAPDKKIATDFLGFNTNQYKIWEAETKDKDGVIEIDYKGLSGRFYFIRKVNKTGSFKLISEKLTDQIVVTDLPVGINSNTLFEEAIFNNYAEYQKIFENFRIHNISLAMTINDFLGLDLTRPVFFKQENAFYICNKISFSEGEKSTGEFIKINKL